MLSGGLYSHMSSVGNTTVRPARRTERRFPAFGPVDAVLGFLLFYYVLDLATPTLVEVLSESGPTFEASVVRFGLAAFLWFVLIVTVLEQVRRQLASLGVGDDTDISRGLFGRATPTEAQTTVTLVLVLLFGLLAVWTFDTAMRTVPAAIRHVANLEFAALLSTEFLLMAVFFVSFSLASTFLDRLVVGGVRMLVSEPVAEPA